MSDDSGSGAKPPEAMGKPRGRARWVSKIGGTLAVLTMLELTGVAVRVVAAVTGPAAGHALSDQAVMWGFIAAALSTGIGSLGAAYAVSHVGAAAVGSMGERPEIAGRALIFVGLAEGIAIYGLIISIMILGRLG
jgi:V/A-type H+/Na+-transporting ATPase subunit K